MDCKSFEPFLGPCGGKRLEIIKVARALNRIKAQDLLWFRVYLADVLMNCAAASYRNTLENLYIC